MQSSLIYVEGIIGAGKSTFVQNLSEKIDNLIAIKEPVEEWQRDGILEKYYKDMRRWALSFQLRIIHDKTKILNKIPNIDNNTYIVERSIYSDQCFTNTLNKFDILDEFDFRLSNDVRDIYEETTTKTPNLIIYLRPSLDTCMQRVKKRNRQEEKNLTVEYQQTLLNYHDDMFNHSHLKIMNNTNVPILILEDNDITDDLIKKIQTYINHQ